MPSYQLVPEDGSPEAPWRVQWDQDRLVLTNAVGEVVLDTEAAAVYPLLDFSRTFIDGTFCIAIPPDVVSFRQNPIVVDGLRRLADLGLSRDPEYRAAMRRRAWRAMLGGPVMLWLAGGLFAAFCWFAIAAPEPEPDSWIHTIKGILKWGVALLLAVALLGLGLTFSGLRQWLRIRRIERLAEASDELERR